MPCPLNAGVYCVSSTWWMSEHLSYENEASAAQNIQGIINKDPHDKWAPIML